MGNSFLDDGMSPPKHFRHEADPENRFLVHRTDRARDRAIAFDRYLSRQNHTPQIEAHPKYHIAVPLPRRPRNEVRYDSRSEARFLRRILGFYDPVTDEQAGDKAIGCLDEQGYIGKETGAAFLRKAGPYSRCICPCMMYSVDTENEALAADIAKSAAWHDQGDYESIVEGRRLAPPKGRGMHFHRQMLRMRRPSRHALDRSAHSERLRAIQQPHEIIETRISALREDSGQLADCIVRVH